MEDNHDFFRAPHLVQRIFIINILISAGVSALITVFMLHNLPYLSEHIPYFNQTTTSTSPNQVSIVPNMNGITDSIPDVVDKSIPAVVSVIISADVPIVERYFENYDPFGDIFGGRGFGFQIPRQREIGTEKREIGGGTGFFVSPDGLIITNKHVVDATGVTYSIVLHDGTTYEAEIVAKDPALDIAVIKVKDKPTEVVFPSLAFGTSSNIRLGATVIAIGNALAEFPNSVSVGVISGLSRDIVAGDGFGQTEALEGVIQTDAAINRGNSGGPLLDTAGRVIGVNVAVAGGGSENIGFALPIDTVRSVFESVQEFGEIIRPYIGVRYIPIDDEIKAANNLSVDYGVIVMRGENRTDLAVIPGSPADKAGIVENDIILEVNGQKLDENSSSLSGIIRTFKVGDMVTLKVLHQGTEKEVMVKLEKAPTS